MPRPTPLSRRCWENRVIQRKQDGQQNAMALSWLKATKGGSNNLVSSPFSASNLSEAELGTVGDQGTL